MSLLRRVKRIERAAAPKGACPMCHGYGPPPAIWRQDMEPEPALRHCRVCGKPATERVAMILAGNAPDPFHDAPVQW